MIYYVYPFAGVKADSQCIRLIENQNLHAHPHYIYQTPHHFPVGFQILRHPLMLCHFPTLQVILQHLLVLRYHIHLKLLSLKID